MLQDIMFMYGLNCFIDVLNICMQGKKRFRKTYIKMVVIITKYCGLQENFIFFVCLCALM